MEGRDRGRLGSFGGRPAPKSVRTAPIGRSPPRRTKSACISRSCGGEWPWLSRSLTSLILRLPFRLSALAWRSGGKSQSIPAMIDVLIVVSSAIFLLNRVQHHVAVRYPIPFHPYRRALNRTNCCFVFKERCLIAFAKGITNRFPH